MLDSIRNKKVCFLTTVFPMPIEYLYDFFDSIVQQNYKLFELVIVNDDNLDLYKVMQEYTSIKTHVLSGGESPVNNRELLIEFALQKKYDIAIFGDSDDKFSSNRICNAVEKLNEADIVINELSTFNKKGVLQHNYLSNRINDNTYIKFEDIIELNVFGLSNTAINCHILDDLSLPFRTDLIALDWYIYSVLLLRQHTALFTNKCITYYRQHESNQVGIGKADFNSIKNAISVKIKHYDAISMYYKKALQLKNNLIEIQHDENKIKELLNTLQSNKNFPLWWELK